MDQDKIKNMFTRYVITAVDRTRSSYIDRTAERYAKEYPVEWESGENPYLYDHKIWDQMEQEAAARLPFKAEDVRNYLREQIEDERQEALTKLTDSEILILFAKVFLQMTFVEIGDMMERDWKSVASSYSYVRKKLKKGWRKNED